MRTTDPQWYEELRGDPLKERTFTRQLEAQIRWRTQAEEERRRSPLRRFAAAAVGGIVLAGAVAFAGQRGGGDEPLHPAGRQAPPPSVSVFVAPPFGSPAPPAIQPPASTDDPERQRISRDIERLRELIESIQRKNKALQQP